LGEDTVQARNLLRRPSPCFAAQPHLRLLQYFLYQLGLTPGDGLVQPFLLRRRELILNVPNPLLLAVL
jgi:hypothetical protein